MQPRPVASLVSPPPPIDGSSHHDLRKSQGQGHAVLDPSSCPGYGASGFRTSGFGVFCFRGSEFGRSRSLGFWGSGLPGVGLRGFKALGLALKG